MLPGEKMRLIDVLRFLKSLYYFSNTIIAYRILMVIHVTIACLRIKKVDISLKLYFDVID